MTLKDLHGLSRTLGTFKDFQGALEHQEVGRKPVEVSRKSAFVYLAHHPTFGACFLKASLIITT